jgi:hypothetical protein
VSRRMLASTVPLTCISGILADMIVKLLVPSTSPTLAASPVPIAVRSRKSASAKVVCPLPPYCVPSRANKGYSRLALIKPAAPAARTVLRGNPLTCREKIAMVDRTVTHRRDRRRDVQRGRAPHARCREIGYPDVAEKNVVDGGAAPCHGIVVSRRPARPTLSETPQVFSSAPTR